MLFIRTIAFGVILAFVATGPAAAAAKHRKAAAPQRVERAATAPQPLNSESPELTGGGSLGHNEMKGW